MNNKKYDYFYTKDSKAEGMTNSVKKSIFFIFAIFLLLFPNYSPLGVYQTQDPSIIQNIFNLYFFISNQTLGIVHEAGHGVCYIMNCPQFITAANGTVFQIGFPLGIAYYYKRKASVFAFFIALYFVGFSLHYTAWYISTAHEGLHISAAKSFLGVDGYHDFNYILDATGLLAYDNAISILIKILAYFLMFRATIGMYFNAFDKNSKINKPNV